jgi:hypothetical protein
MACFFFIFFKKNSDNAQIGWVDVNIGFGKQAKPNFWVTGNGTVTLSGVHAGAKKSDIELTQLVERATDSPRIVLVDCASNVALLTYFRLSGAIATPLQLNPGHVGEREVRLMTESGASMTYQLFNVATYWGVWLSDARVTVVDSTLLLFFSVSKGGNATHPTRIDNVAPITTHDNNDIAMIAGNTHVTLRNSTVPIVNLYIEAGDGAAPLDESNSAISINNTVVGEFACTGAFDLTLTNVDWNGKNYYYYCYYSLLGRRQYL